MELDKRYKEFKKQILQKEKSFIKEFKEINKNVKTDSPICLKKTEKFILKELSKYLKPNDLKNFEIKKWTSISLNLKTKSYDQIKNFYNQKLKKLVELNFQKTSKKKLIGIIKQIIVQDIKNLNQIDYSLIDNDLSELKNKSK